MIFSLFNDNIPVRYLYKSVNLVRTGTVVHRTVGPGTLPQLTFILDHRYIAALFPVFAPPDQLYRYRTGSKVPTYLLSVPTVTSVNQVSCPVFSIGDGRYRLVSYRKGPNSGRNFNFDAKYCYETIFLKLKLLNKKHVGTSILAI